MRHVMGLIIGLIVAGAGLLFVGQRHQELTARIKHLEVTSRFRASTKVVEVQDRVIDLPEDGHTWHTILFLRPDWKSRPDERRAHTIFHTEKGLISLRQQTHWHVITVDQPEFRPFASLVTVTPSLLIERANGQAVYRESGPQLGRGDDALQRAIRREVARHCPDGRCLPIHPVPGPKPPLEDEEDEVPLVIRETPAPEKKGGGMAAMLAALAAAGGAAFQWKKAG